MTDIPLLSECVIGYRQWKLADWVLLPLAVGDPWRPGVNRARCRKLDRGLAGAINPFAAAVASMQLGLTSSGTLEPRPAEHHAPHEGCHCGIYVLHEAPETSAGSAYVTGAVAAWGNLRVHHNGVRAEYAQIVALANPQHLDDDKLPGFALAAEHYRVPVVSAHELEAEALKHGQPIPSSMRPEKPTPEFEITVNLPISYPISYPTQLGGNTSPWSYGGPYSSGLLSPPGGDSARDRRRWRRMFGI